MANHTLKGFASVQERVAFQNALIEAQNKIGEIARHTRSNSASQPTLAYRRWFGQINRQRMERVVGVISAM